MVKAISIRITILHVSEEQLTQVQNGLPGGRDWLEARRLGMAAIEETFNRLSYGQVFQVTIEREETDAAEVFSSDEES